MYKELLMRFHELYEVLCYNHNNNNATRIFFLFCLSILYKRTNRTSLSLCACLPIVNSKYTPGESLRALIAVLMSFSPSWCTIRQYDK